MKKYSVIVLIAVILISVVSCKQQVAYTKAVKTQYGLDDEKLKSLQYYLMGDIVLNKSSSQDNTELAKGEILINESQNLDKVIFRAGTQGLFVKELENGNLAISFEKSDDFYLEFGATTEKGLYKFQAETWTSAGNGKVVYGGEEFLSSRASADAYITVKVKKSSKYNANQRIAKGRKV